MGPRAISHNRFALREESFCLEVSCRMEVIDAEKPGGLGRSEGFLPALVKSKLHRPLFLGGCAAITGIVYNQNVSNSSI